MSVQLTMSEDNKIQTLNSGSTGDILDLYFTNAIPGTVRNITITASRNCCFDKSITYVLPPTYNIVVTAITDDPYSPGVASSNNRQAYFQITGIDPSYISEIQVESNLSNPTTTTFAMEVVDVDVATTGVGYPIYYLLADVTATYKAVITTIDGYVFELDIEYDWADSVVGGTTSTAVITARPSAPTDLTIDTVANTISFDTTAWGLSTTDDVFPDGVYKYDLVASNVNAADLVEVVHKFFNIKLECLITDYIAHNHKDGLLSALYYALVASNDCELSAAKKCKLYEQIIKKLILNNQIKVTSSLGCNCGCS